jgi:hypothetical protein
LDVGTTVVDFCWCVCSVQTLNSYFQEEGDISM